MILIGTAKKIVSLCDAAEEIDARSSSDDVMKSKKSRVDVEDNVLGR
jgi:hypothetical protein